MKLKLLFTLTALVLALCFTLAACGEQQTGSATADSATADSAETVADAALPQSAPDSASSKEEVSSASSSAADAAPAPVVNNAEAPDISYEEDTPVQEEKQEEQHASSSAASSKASSGASSKASSGNPAYDEGEQPVFTISLTNKSTKKTYSASCSYKTDKEDVASAAFFLPGGEYDIAVYEYTESKDKGDPLAKSTYQNSIAENKRKSIVVSYTPKDNNIEVEVSTSSRNQ